jgi:hypothetical protein
MADRCERVGDDRPRGGRVKRLWTWVAWTNGRDRICDAGIAWADDKQGAEAVGWMSLGGPWARSVERIEVVLVGLFQEVEPS